MINIQEAFNQSFLEAVADLIIELENIKELAEDDNMESAMDELEGQAGRIQSIINGEF